MLFSKTHRLYVIQNFVDLDRIGRHLHSLLLKFALIVTASLVADPSNCAHAQYTSSNDTTMCSVTTGSITLQSDVSESFSVTCLNCEVTQVTDATVNGQSVLLARDYLPQTNGEPFYPLHSSFNAYPMGTNTVGLTIHCADGSQTTIISTLSIAGDVTAGSTQSTALPSTFVEEPMLSDAEHSEIEDDINAQLEEINQTVQSQQTSQSSPSASPQSEPNSCEFKIGPLFIPYFEINGEQLPGREPFKFGDPGVPDGISLAPGAMTVKQKADYYRNELVRRITTGIEDNPDTEDNESESPIFTHKVKKVFDYLPGPQVATFKARLPQSGELARVVPFKVSIPAANSANPWSTHGLAPVWLDSTTRTQIVGVALELIQDSGDLDGFKLSAGATSMLNAWSASHRESVGVFIFDYALPANGIVATGTPENPVYAKTFMGLAVYKSRAILISLQNYSGFPINGPAFQSSVQPYQGNSSSTFYSPASSASTLAHEIGHHMGLDHIRLGNSVIGTSNLMTAEYWGSSKSLTPHQACWLRDRCFNAQKRFRNRISTSGPLPGGPVSDDPGVSNGEFCMNGHLGTGYFALIPGNLDRVIGPDTMQETMPFPIYREGLSYDNGECLGGYLPGGECFTSVDVGEQCDMMFGEPQEDVSSYMINCGLVNPSPEGNKVDLGNVSPKFKRRWGKKDAKSPFACYKNLPAAIPAEGYRQCQLRQTCGNFRLDTESEVAEGCDPSAKRPGSNGGNFDDSYCKEEFASVTQPVGTVVECGYSERDPTNGVETLHQCNCGFNCSVAGAIYYGGTCRRCCSRDAIGCAVENGVSKCLCPPGKMHDDTNQRCVNEENGASTQSPEP